MIKIYSKLGCSYCVAAIRLAEMKNKEYQEIKIGEDISREEFVEKYPQVATVPAIFIDDEFIGGFKELKIRIQ
jgi:glutaredoxin